MLARLAALAALVACDRSSATRQSAPLSSAPEPSPVAPRASPCTLAPIPTRVAAPHRVVAIGDLHGDLAAARAALRAAGAIDEQDAWIGGDLVVVQAGDILDRGDEESTIVELLERLDRDARAAGGAVVALLGNHELMNAAGDFRYVTAGGLRDFGGDREHALAPGGVWAKRLAQHNAIAIVGGAVISHAGVLGDWARDVDALNLEARCFLDGQASGRPTMLESDTSPLWTRALGGGEVDCAALAAALKTLGATRMVVAHTVQPGGINAKCDGALWRIDVGLARLYGGPIQVLELSSEPPQVRVGSRLR
jgi:hypothetical protein